MRFLRKNTAVIVTVGPFYDKTDGVTIETGLTISNERITLTADTDDGSAPTNILDNVTGATSGTANDLNYITGNDAGMMQLELAAADTNRLGRMFLSITDAANHVPVFHEFMVLNAALYDAFFATSGGAIPNVAAGASTGLPLSADASGRVDVLKINGTSQTARDIGASVLLSSGTGTGQLDFTSGVVKANATQILGTAVSTPATAGILDVNVKNIDNDAASASGTVTFPNATLASTTNITAGTITTVTNLTNAPTSGDLTAAMKASVNTEVDTAIADARLDELLAADSDIDGAAPPTVGSVFHELLSKTAGSFTFDQTTDSLEAVRDKLADIETDTAEIGVAGAGLTNINLPDQTMDITGSISGSVGSVTGSVGSVTGSVGSVTGAVGSVTGAVGSVTAAVTVGAVNAAGLADLFDTDSGKTYADAVSGSVVKEIADNAGGGAPPTAGEIADAVWDEAIAGHAGAGSTGEKLNDAGAGGDPWNTALPGSYGAGTAGKIVGDGLAAVPPTAAQNADTLLGRNIAGGSNGGRTVKDALRISRNKVAESGGTLTIYQEDDTTPAWTAAVTRTAADPVSAIDPA